MSINKRCFYSEKKIKHRWVFSIKKKSLVLPPGYGKLHIDDEVEDGELNVFVNNEENISSSTFEKNSKPSSIEESILQKIE